MIEKPHKFYFKSTKAQNQYLCYVITTLFLSVLLVAWIAWYLDCLFLTILIPLIVLNIAPFIDVPLGARKGRFVYHSACFLTEWSHDGRLVVHGGTLFDYWYAIDRDLSVKDRRRYVFKLYLEGLLNLIEHHAIKDNLDIKIIGTTYFINRKNLERFGFHIKPTSFLQLLLILVNYFNISLAMSYINRHPKLFTLDNLYTFEADINELLQKRKNIEDLHERLC